MKVDIFNIKKFVELNELKPVTRSIYLNQDNTPTNDGIFSYDIFGYPGSKERKLMPGYIDLKGHYIHPLVYKRWVLMDRKILGVIAGVDTYTIYKGELVVYDETKHGKVTAATKVKPGTGLEWLYENYQELRYQKTDSTIRNNNITLITTLHKDELFCSYWLVQPAFFRDLDFSKLKSGKIAVDEINKYYMSLISNCESASRPTNISFVSHAARGRVQKTLVDIYDYLQNQNSGKTGMTRNYIIGKNLDYTARTVISCPCADRAETYQDFEVKLGEIGIPLHVLCAIFRPFILRHIRELITDKLKNVTKVYFGVEMKEGVDIMSDTFSEANIERMLSLYEKSYEDRFAPIMVQTKEGGKPEPWLMYHKVLKRPFTLVDLFFLACYKAIEDKTVFYTRYPVVSHLSKLPAKPGIITTQKTVVMDFNLMLDEEDRLAGKQSSFGVIKNYPNIHYKDSWRDASVMNNLTCAILDGDFDGDTVSEEGIFSKEANAEVRGIINSKKMLVKGNGEPSMSIKMDTAFSFFMLTYADM